jgi:hypothetical protein
VLIDKDDSIHRHLIDIPKKNKKKNFKERNCIRTFGKFNEVDRVVEGVLFVVDFRVGEITLVDVMTLLFDRD